ncbi:MAG TPA: hypothetical protein VD927_07170 [Chryseosolibacter sp.]|nr:hypothetical protein [Chryseosolibacter sp.]
MRLYIRILSLTILLTATTTLCAQDFGLSFSYFIPKNGEFSTPISPFSIRGIGVDLNKFLALETGVSLYRMSGLNLKGLPFESKKSLLGPNFTVLVPAELVLQLRGSSFQFDIKGGGFFFYGFDQRINYGNLDRAIRTYEQWEVANTTASFKNHPGFGYHAGFEFTVYVTSQVGISLETNYLVGEAKFPLSGSYSGGDTSMETRSFDYAQSKIDMTGLEFSIGVIMTNGGGAPKKPKAKRRRR